MDLFPLSYKTKIGLILAGLVIWSIPCYVSIVKPRLKTLHEKQKQLSSLNQQLAQLRDEKEKLQQLAKEMPSDSLADKQVYQASEIPVFIRDLNQITSTSGASLVKVDLSGFVSKNSSFNKNSLHEDELSEQISKVAASMKADMAKLAQLNKQAFETENKDEDNKIKTALIKPIPIIVTIDGKFPQVYNVLRKLESYHHLIAVQDIETGTQSSGYPKLKMTLPLVVYVSDLKMEAPVTQSSQPSSQ